MYVYIYIYMYGPGPPAPTHAPPHGAVYAARYAPPPLSSEYRCFSVIDLCGVESGLSDGQTLTRGE